MTGNDLKILLANNNMTGTELATLMNKNKRTIYEWFAKGQLSRTLTERILKITRFKIKEKSDNEEQQWTHHGEAVKKILQEKGIKQTSFANQMGYTRRTLYQRLGELQWDEGELLKAAQLLKISVAQLKGKGDGQYGFEKDIYEKLNLISKQINDLHKHFLST